VGGKLPFITLILQPAPERKSGGFHRNGALQDWIVRPPINSESSSVIPIHSSQRKMLGCSCYEDAPAVLAFPLTISLSACSQSSSACPSSLPRCSYSSCARRQICSSRSAMDRGLGSTTVGRESLVLVDFIATGSPVSNKV
jgi:hypothetical protein